MYSRNEERGDESFTEHELSGTINPGHRHDAQKLFTIKIARLTEGKGFRHWPKKIFPCKSAGEMAVAVAKKGKLVEIKGPFFNPVFLKTWNFYGRTFAPYYQSPSTFSEPRIPPWGTSRIVSRGTSHAFFRHFFFSSRRFVSFFLSFVL